jgi:TetR/AcrR family transcriptional regulator, cholesterol catabolism regulator
MASLVRRPRDPMRRRRILDAAKRSFTAYGIKGTSLDAVAAQAGCAKGALYLEFADKEELLREVVAETFAAIRARFDSEVVGIPSPLDRLVGTLRFAYRQFAAEPMFARLMRDDPDLRVLVPAGGEVEMKRAAEAQAEQLKAWVDEGIRHGEIRPDVDREAIPMVIGVLRFAPEHLGLATSLGVGSTERTLDAVLDVFRAGLAARVEAGRSRTSPRKARKTSKPKARTVKPRRAK